MSFGAGQTACLVRAATINVRAAALGGGGSRFEGGETTACAGVVACSTRRAALYMRGGGRKKPVLTATGERPPLVPPSPQDCPVNCFWYAVCRRDRPMPSFNIRYRSGTESTTPIDANQVVEMANAGKVHPEDLLQIAGKNGAAWLEAWRYRELFDPAVSAKYEQGNTSEPTNPVPAAPAPAPQPLPPVQAGGSTGWTGAVMGVGGLLALVGGVVWLISWLSPESKIDPTPWIWATGIGIVIVGLFACFAEQQAKQVFVAGFDAIKVGMTVDDVERLLSEPAKEISRSATPDLEKPGEFIEVVMYSWNGLDGSHLTVVTVGGRIISKDISGVGSLMGIPGVTSESTTRRRY